MLLVIKEILEYL